MSAVKCCKDCTDRYVGCHSVCEKYLSEKKICDEEREAVFKSRETLRGIRDVRFRKLKENLR